MWHLHTEVNSVKIMVVKDQLLLDELYASYNGDAYATYLKGIVERYGDLKTAEMIIDQYEDSLHTSGDTTVIGFQTNYHLFWKRVKIEFNKLVCGHSQYEKEGQDFFVYGKFFSLATASAMASSISQVVDVPIYVLTPTIALMLNSIMKIGRNAYCSTVVI